MSSARVLWLDGLPLAPQHFQEADRLHQEALEARLALTYGARWGLRQVTLDARALAEGTVRVERLDAVFPDGTAVVIAPGSAVTVEDRVVAGFGPDRSEITVHVALARHRSGRPELGIPDARLRSVVRRCADAHTETPAEPVDVELGVPALRIVLGHEPHDDLDMVPLATLRRDAHGEVRIASTIVGPLLAIGGSEALTSRLARLVERLGTRRAALVAARHQRDAESIEVDPTDITRFALASTIATHHPVLRHVLRRADTTPEALFERLLGLAGALSVLAVDADLELPDLDLAAPERAFAALFDRIDALLAATDRERARVIPLEPRSDGLHFARLDDEAARAERFYVAVRSVRAVAEVERTLGGLAKLASFSEIAGVLETATPGATLQVVHRPPPEVPLHADETCFEIVASDRFFRAALAERGVAVYLPARAFDPAHTRLTLVAIARHGTERTDRSAPALGAPS